MGVTHRGELPTGTVTFLFSDIEGSTRLLQRLGDGYVEVLQMHQRLLRDAFARHGGTEVGTEGDSFFVAFPAATAALAAAVEAQRSLADAAWPDGAEVRVRMGLHSGLGTLGADGYVGIDVHRAARVAASGHGGQTVLSASTRALVEHDLADSIELRDLGEHRLKDLLQPEHLYQVVHPSLPDEFPPLRTLTARPNNLPGQTSEFLGREAEVAAISDALHTDGVRLVSITGPGGMGKTRLALQVAADQTERCEDGVFLVELAAVRVVDEALEAIMRAVGVTSTGDAGPLEAVAQGLESRHLLLVLDNLEQVMGVADGVVQILQRCPHVRVLVTSREALSVRGEHVFALPPLSLPPARTASAQTAAEYEAVRLFVARARQVRPDFDLTDDNAHTVADICTRLDGLPLAIELAAARVKLFSLDDLRDRLHDRLQVLRGGARDLPARHQALRDTIEWSYELLDADERSTFCLLSVFSTARLADVEAVAARIDSLRQVDIVEQVASLVDKSLARSGELAGGQRLSMLETIREYAEGRLAEDPEFSGAARRAHAEHFSDVARAASSQSDGAERDAAFAQLDADLGNLQTAWRHWLTAEDLAQLDELLKTLWPLHDARGSYTATVELTQELLAVLSRVPSTPQTVEQKVVLAISVARGLLAIRGYTKDVDDAYQRALELLTEAGELPKLFPVLRSLASIYLYRTEFDKAVAVGRQLLELAEQQHDTSVQVDGHLVLGANLTSLGDLQGGLQHLERAIELFDSGQQRPPRFRLGASPGVVARTTSAFDLWLQGYPDRALARADEAVALAIRLNHPFTLAYAWYHVALHALWRHELALVQERASHALDLADEHGYPIWHALALVLQGVAMAGLGQAEAGLARAEQGVSMYTGLSTPPVFWPMILSLRAQAFGLAGRPVEGMPFVDEAIDLFGGRANFLFPEIPLLKGELLLASSGPEAAEPWFQQAFDIAEAEGTRMPQLRAATRLVRVRRALEAEPDGLDVLRGVYVTFTEGFTTPDLLAAKALLDE